ncbi:MAG: aminopeptidase P family protein [Proteobacteria bacterium]|nr:aminopeptidase P family protein [Pseudomonadota bacterium]
MTEPTRGFSQTEFEARTGLTQQLMHAANLDAILVTTEAEIRYYTGFHTQFFESPTRPWFLVIPAEGKPIAVIPAIGETGMCATWIDDVHTWPSPRPSDDGISLLTNVIDTLSSRFGRVGMTLGPESILRMPAADAQTLAQNLSSDVVDCAELLLQQRFVKSPAEIEKIRHVCQITSGAFETLPRFAEIGHSELDITKRMRIDLLERGADNTPFMVAGSGPGGYDSIIMGPTSRIPESGDVLIIDTGTVFDGYFCDFDRNFGFRHVADDTARANDAIHQALDAGFEAARPGAKMRDVWSAMWKIMEDAGALGNSIGRMGHGLGMLLTEWPSVHPDDQRVLEPGVVMTLEPGMTFDPGRQLVHEENIVITEDGAEYLTRRAPPEIPVIQ